MRLAVENIDKIRNIVSQTHKCVHLDCHHGGAKSRPSKLRQTQVDKGELLQDGRSVLIHIADMKPTWSMEIRCRMKAADGTKIDSTIHNTIHNLGSD